MVPIQEHRALHVIAVDSQNLETGQLRMVTQPFAVWLDYTYRYSGSRLIDAGDVVLVVDATREDPHSGHTFVDVLTQHGLVTVLDDYVTFNSYVVTR